jgi:hypothetical protein
MTLSLLPERSSSMSLSLVRKSEGKRKRTKASEQRVRDEDDGSEIRVIILEQQEAYISDEGEVGGSASRDEDGKAGDSPSKANRGRSTKAKPKATTKLTRNRFRLQTK